MFGMIRGIMSLQHFHSSIANIPALIVANRNITSGAANRAMGHIDNSQILPRLVNNLMLGENVDSHSGNQSGYGYKLSEKFTNRVGGFSSCSKANAGAVLVNNASDELAWIVRTYHATVSTTFYQRLMAQPITIGEDEIVYFGSSVDTKDVNGWSNNGFKTMQGLRVVNGDARFNADANIAAFCYQKDSGTSSANNDVYALLGVNKATGALTKHFDNQAGSVGNNKHAGSIFVHDDGYLNAYVQSDNSGGLQLKIRAIAATSPITNHIVDISQSYMTLTRWDLITKLCGTGENIPLADDVLYSIGVQFTDDFIEADIFSRAKNTHSTLALVSTETLSGIVGNWQYNRASSITLHLLQKQIVWCGDATAGKLLVLVITHAGDGVITVEEILLENMHTDSSAPEFVSIVEVEDLSGFYINYRVTAGTYTSHFHKIN